MKTKYIQWNDDDFLFWYWDQHLIIPILSQLVFALSPSVCVLNWEPEQY